jgi:hypothetical protein
MQHYAAEPQNLLAVVMSANNGESQTSSSLALREWLTRSADNSTASDATDIARQYDPTGSRTMSESVVLSEERHPDSHLLLDYGHG